MKLLVIGGTGFVSGAVVSQLQHAGHDVTIVTRGARQVPEEVRAIRVDRNNRDAFKEALKGQSFDGVIDCIGYEPADAQQDVDVFKGVAGHLIFISTDFTYGTASNPGAHRQLPITEDAPTDAYNSYGQNKVVCENILRSEEVARIMPVTILRPPHVIGEGGQLGTGSLYGRDPRLIDAIKRGVPQILLDEGSLLIQPVANTDIGSACAACIANAGTYGKTYNLSGGQCVTTTRYYEYIAETIDGTLAMLSLPSSIYIGAFPDRRPFAQHRMYDMSRLLHDAGWQPEIDVRTAIEQTVVWLELTGNAIPYTPRPGEAELIVALERHRLDLATLISTGSGEW